MNRANIAISLIFVPISVFAILFVNFNIISHFFEGEFSQNMGSIEISYISMAKFWSEGGGLWNPLWYLGYPWHVFYTPLLPTLELVLHNIFGFSFAHAYRFISASGYVLSPVALYFFVWQLSKSKTGALVSALCYSVAPSLIALMFSEVAQDTLGGGFEPRRFAILVRWGEGPHTFALTFVPIFGFFLARFLEGKKFVYAVLSAFFFMLVSITNAVALWGAILLFVAFFLGYVSKKEVEPVALFKRMLFMLALAVGFMSFWYNLPFIKTFFREGGGAFGNWSAMFPWGFLIILAIFGVIFYLVRRFLGRFSGLPTAFWWFLFLFGIVYTYYASGENHLEYAPQALRLNTEADMALSVLLGTIVSCLYLYLVSVSNKFKIILSTVGVLIVIVPVVLLFWQYTKITNLAKHTYDISHSPIKSLENTQEYKVSQNLLEMTKGTNERVLVPGNYAFWLNYFVSVPQLRGALYQSSTHYWPEHAYYQITNGQDKEMSLAWLKIANIGKLVYTTPASSEIYKDFKVGEDKFNSILTTNKTESGNIYFNVPLKNNSFAKVVSVSKYKELTVPKNAIDKKPVNKYVEYLEEFSENRLDVNRLGSSKIRIRGEVGENQGIMVHETYDSGWKIKGGGKAKKDALGFIFIDVDKAGKVDLTLSYTKPLSVYLGYLVTILTIGFVVWKLAFQKTGKSEDQKSENQVVR